MGKKIPVLQPVLPKVESLMPYLQEIDGNHIYTNFGPLLERFEDKLKQIFFPGAGLVTTSSGTHALELAIQALGLEPGSRVLVPSFTFPATITAILKNHLVPCFSDVDSDCWQLTPAIARSVVKNNDISMVLPVATYGVPVNAEAWSKFQYDTGLPVVVDAAASLGAQQLADNVTFCFSLHATKPFSCGEGGLVVAGSQELLDKARRLTNFGLQEGQISMLGTNAKLSEYHAAVGLAYFALWEEQKQQRKSLLLHYKELLEPLPCKLQTHDDSWIPAVFSVLFENDIDTNELASELVNEGVETRRWYFPACHNHSNLSGQRFTSLDNVNLEVTDMLSGQLLGLPFHPGLSLSELEYIVGLVSRAISK